MYREWKYRGWKYREWKYKEWKYREWKYREWKYKEWKYKEWKYRQRIKVRVKRVRLHWRMVQLAMIAMCVYTCVWIQASKLKAVGVNITGKSIESDLLLSARVKHHLVEERVVCLAEVIFVIHRHFTSIILQ